jgi:hypothetical protein
MTTALTVASPTQLAGVDLVHHASQLRAAFDGLRTFEQVAQWDAAATALAQQLQRALEISQQHHQGLLAQADEARRQHVAKPFFKRLFGRSSEPEIRAQANQVHGHRENLGMLINELLELIDYTPNDDKECKELLKELRGDKKELQVKKREIAAQKRAINHAARAASATAGRTGIIFVTYDSKLAAAQRRAIRRDRMAALAPHEDQQHAIEHEIIALDRRILWLERFGKD